MNRQIDGERETDGQKVRCMNRQMDKQTDKGADRQRDMKLDGKTDELNGQTQSQKCKRTDGHTHDRFSRKNGPLLSSTF